MKSLLKYFTPKNYKLSLKLDPAAHSFSGTIIMRGEPVAQEVRLNIGNNLKVTEVACGTNDKPKWKIIDAQLSESGRPELVVYAKTQWVSVKFQSESIKESALSGLYMPSYQLNGETNYMFSTQFEPNYAADCFPCIDEPAAKATFDVDVALPKKYDRWTVLSNMPEARRIGRRRYFETTPLMSTYLVAVVAGELVSKSATTKSGVKVSTYATPAQDSVALEYPLDTAVRALEFYEDYFGIPYPLPKLDNVAIPDFSAGAMENWGLITYRESMFLADIASSVDTREIVVSTVAHEIAHQWFGDLVTMRWWNDLWLNESFASLMEDMAGDALHPEFHVWENFLAGDAYAAAKRDMAHDVQAVQQEVHDPRAIPLLFDSAIVYAKGKRLLLMLQHYLGKDQFRAGVREYLSKHEYGNSTAMDLWQALSHVSGQDVSALMTPWLTQPGYPVVHVKRSGNQVTLRQERLGATKGDKTVWPIPLFANDAAAPQLLSDRSASFTLSNTGDEFCLQLNMGGVAHFVTDYDLDEFGVEPDISEQQTLDQIKQINDDLILSQVEGAERFNHTIAYVQYIMYIENPAVLMAATRVASFARRMLQDDQNPDFREFIGVVYFPLYLKYFVDERLQDLQVADRQILPLVINAELYAGQDSVVKGLLEIYHREDVTTFDKDVRATIMAAGVMYGKGDEFRELWQKYLATSDADLREDICSALCRTRRSKDIYVILTRLTDGTVRAQDTPSFIYCLLSNPTAQPLAWHWIMDNWSYIMKLYGDDMSYDDFIRMAGATLITKSQEREFKEFFQPLAKNVPAIGRTVKIADEQINKRVKLAQECGPIVADYADFVLHDPAAQSYGDDDNGSIFYDYENDEWSPGW